MCGDYISVPVAVPPAAGSPPPVRGLLGDTWDLIAYRGITPACAGTTKILHRYSRLVGDHPCMCGDYEDFMEINVKVSGSPPPVRGLLKMPEKGEAGQGITPACAGTTSHTSVG